ncbi:hypothetical protein Sjap_024164 [Stephania japonica]|uniref:Uncharacterized protein n=1 Tax=Stephania japonica TaxID=461633 RepID=A0AAP0HNG0_9MAGN
MGDGEGEGVEGGDDGVVAAVADVFHVFDAGREEGVGGEGEDEGVDGVGVGGEEGLEEWEVFGGHHHRGGGGGAAEDEEVGEVEEGEHVALRRVGEDQDVWAVCAIVVAVCSGEGR